MTEQNAKSTSKTHNLVRKLFTGRRDGPRKGLDAEPSDEVALSSPLRVSASNVTDLSDEHPSIPHDDAHQDKIFRNEHGVRQRVPQSPSQLRDGVRCDIDIVAVHGLGGHALHTWTANNGKNWLIDDEFLPTALPTARILTFGYNANKFGDQVASKVMDHANALLGGLLPDRVTDELRPIIFIAHSLGGIVVKEALTSNRPEYQSIVQSTSAIIFLGTPHHGSNLAGKLEAVKRLIAWAQLEKHPRSRLEVELQPFSDTIRSVNERFTTPANRYRMRSFAEQKPMYLPPPFGSQLIVPQASALLGHPNELPIPVPANHSTICKFETPEDDVYFSIRQQLIYLKGMSQKHTAKVGIGTNELIDRLNALTTPAETLPTHTCRSCDVPYINDVNIFGTQTAIDQVRTHFAEDLDKTVCTLQCVVLHGIGGVGKSTIANLYAANCRDKYERIFWTSARQAGGIACFDALKYNISEWARDLESSFVRRATDQRRRWLLVIDNLDDLSGISKQNFYNLLPHNSRCHVIITSRHRRTATFGTHSIDVKPLSTAEGVSMLLSLSFNRTKTLRDEIVAAEIVRKLDGLPLAIRQCAAYANQLQLRLTDYPSRIESLLEQIDSEVSAVGAQTAQLGGDQNEECQSLYAVGQISFQQLLDTSPLAAELLTLVAYFDASDISEAVIYRGFQRLGGWTESGDWTYETLSSLQCKALNELLKSLQPHKELSLALATLFDFSLIHRTGRQNNLCLHPVTQYWLRRRSRSLSKTILSDAFSIIEHGFPESEPLLPSMIIGACYHPYLSNYKLHVRALLTWLATEQENMTPDTTSVAMRLAIKAYDMYVVKQQGDECLWLNKSFMEAIFGHVEVPINLWFEAVAVMSTEIRKDFKFPRDLFQCLPDLTFAGRSWEEQRKRLQSALSEPRQETAGTDGATCPTDNSDNVPHVYKAAQSRTIQAQIPNHLTQAAMRLDEAITNIRSAGGITIEERTCSTSMFLPIDPVLSVNGSVIPSVSIQILRFVCNLSVWWQSNKARPIQTDDGIVIDARDGGQQLGFVLQRYYHADKPSPLSRRERFYLGRVLYLLSRSDLASEDLDFKRQCLESSLSQFDASVGLSFNSTAAAVHNLVLLDVQLGKTTAIATLRSSSGTVINEYNFTVIRDLALYHADVLKLTNRPLDRIEVIETQLQKFNQVPFHLRQYWEFYNDPILDMYEELILCYGNIIAKERDLVNALHDYVDYTNKNYPPPPFADEEGLYTYANYLAFGVGSLLSDDSHTRVRVYIEDNGNVVTSVIFVVNCLTRADTLFNSKEKEHRKTGSLGASEERIK